jgi:hypothetical protein
VRFFPLKNADGQIVADTYLMVMDYNGVNYDYNDNMFLITNIRPETGATPASVEHRRHRCPPTAASSTAQSLRAISIDVGAAGSVPVSTDFSDFACLPPNNGTWIEPRLERSRAAAFSPRRITSARPATTPPTGRRSQPRGRRSRASTARISIAGDRVLFQGGKTFTVCRHGGANVDRNGGFESRSTSGRHDGHVAGGATISKSAGLSLGHERDQAGARPAAVAARAERHVEGLRRNQAY